MTTQALFIVTITDPKTHNKPIELPVPRTGREVEHLRRAYAKIEARLIERPMPPVGNERLFADAISALVRLYRASAAKGHDDLANRAEKAVAELLGDQKHLRYESGNGATWPKPAERRRDSDSTLVGIGGGQR